MKLRFGKGFGTKKKNFLGIDVDAEEIRAAELKINGSGFEFVATAVVPGLGKTNEGLPGKEELSQLLSKLTGGAAFSTKQAVSALPGTVVIERLIQLPQMPLKEIDEAVRWEARQLIPVPLDEMIIRHVLLGEISGEEKKLNVLVAAAPQKMLYQFYQSFEDAGLELVAVDLPVLGLWRFFCAAAKESRCAGTISFIDVGSHVTRMMVVADGQILFARSVALEVSLDTFAAGAGPAFEENLVFKISNLEGSFSEAAAALDLSAGVDPVAGRLSSRREETGSDRRRSILFTPEEEEFAADLPDQMSGLVLEIRRSMEYFRGMHANQELEKLVLSGTAARRTELADLLAAALKVEVVLGTSPFIPVNPDGGSEFDPALAVAAGLSLWGVKG